MVSRFFPRKDFQDCEKAGDGYRRYNDCRQQCIDSYSSCLSKTTQQCASCGAYCEKKCNPQSLLSNGYCENVCSHQRNRAPNCVRACRSTVLGNVNGCRSICNKNCSADCPKYIKTQCAVDACTIPICQKNCTRSATSPNDFYLAPSLIQSLLNKPTYYCKVGSDVNNKCLDVDANTKTWYYTSV